LTDRAKGAVTSAAERAREEASRVTQAASEKASELAERARQSAREAADAAKARAKQAADHGASLADDVSDGAQGGLHRAGEEAGSFFDRFQAIGADAMQFMRDGTRTALVAAANALDEYSAKARKSARSERWEALRKRFQFAAEQPSPAISDELRDHAFRVARIKRAREIAEAAGDARSVKRSDNLLESEYARSNDRLLSLREEEQHTEEAEP
jgi:hypothetical protein